MSYGRGRGGWNNLGPMIAMMAASAASDWEHNERRSRRSRDWQDDARPRKRRGRMFGSGELRLALLALINEEPRHGYELIRAIEDMTGGSYAPSPGAVYPTLQMLEEEGQIKPAKVKASEDDEDGSSKKPFKATKSGKAELAERAEEVDELIDMVTQVHPELAPLLGQVAIDGHQGGTPGRPIAPTNLANLALRTSTTLVALAG